MMPSLHTLTEPKPADGQTYATPRRRAKAGRTVRSGLFFGSFTALAMVLTACENAPDASPAPAETDVSLVQTASGPIRGEVSDTGRYVSFRSVPFAAPPVGDLRFAPPQKPASWTEPLDAMDIAPACPQTLPEPGAWNYAADLSYSEDCLYLNVFAPADAIAADDADLPVMFWIHGGSFSQGTASQPVFRDPAPYIERDAILVTVNYRLSALGYLAHPDFSAKAETGTSGNYAVLDQIAALEWVKDNIAAFGGDADNVTVFGESAGALSINALMAAPPAQDLFDKVIVQSGGAWGFSPYTKSLEDAEAWGETFLAERGAQTLEDAQALDTEAFINLPINYSFELQPLADGVVLNDPSADEFLRGNQSGQDMLIGWTREETGNFPNEVASREAAEDIFVSMFGEEYGPALLSDWIAASDGDLNYAMIASSTGSIAQGSLYQAKLQLEKTDNVFVYRFDLAPPSKNGEATYAVHGADVPFTFGHEPDGTSWREMDFSVSDALIDYWVNFARTGNPNGEDLPDWPTFDPQSPDIMSFGAETGAMPLSEYPLIMRTVTEFNRDLIESYTGETD